MNEINAWVWFAVLLLFGMLWAFVSAWFIAPFVVCALLFIFAPITTPSGRRYIMWGKGKTPRPRRR